MKESYENMKHLLSFIHCNKYCWNICGDLKVSVLLLGMRLVCMKFICLLCEWDSRARDHYAVTEWPSHKRILPGQKNI
jgi:hypothetical protein